MQNTGPPPSNELAPFTWRRATRADAKELLELITALAHFEKLPPPDAEACKRLIEHGFGERPKFESWLTFWNGVQQPIGYAVLFEAYSTFRANPTLYLEDLFILPEYQKRGVGSAFLRYCIQMAYERGCGRMEWTCLDWNTKAQAVYERLGARRLSEWYLYRLTREDMEKLLSDTRKAPPGL
jgi:GNAT superfamily N-acetyltransferase